MAGYTQQETWTRTALSEAQWLINNPEFKERPASVAEFLGPDYLNIEAGVRPGVKECLVEIFGDEPNVFSIAEVEAAMFTGAIGIGKTTFASIALPYMVHWCLCLKNPQTFLGLLPGTRIAFMMMSTSEKQAKEVLFGDIFARIKHSKWFKDYPYDPKFTSQIRFPNDIWIVPGDSSDTTFEGYNILAGVIDEMDSHKVTEKKDYALDGYNTIRNRITSRFGNRGLLILIGQMKNSTGFAATKYQEFIDDGREGSRYAKKLTIWDSLGWQKFLNADGTRDSFFFDLKRKAIIDKAMADFINDPSIVMEIPRVYKKDFQGNPEQALRDHAGIPPMVGDSFIGMVDKVESCVSAWTRRNDGVRTPVRPNLNHPEFESWFVAQNTLPRAAHVDLSYSAAGDAVGIAMGHVPELKTIDDELKPVIVFDCLIRIRPLPGRQIILADVRQIIYDLRDERKFNITSVSFDGFQCLTGDTKIPLLDGRTLSMKELAERYPNGGFETYSYNGQKITFGKCTKAWRTGVREVVSVVLDNNESIRCTPDHLFMLRDGSYREAQNLSSGDSLMPLYRRITDVRVNHKVLSVSKTLISEDVYDLQIEDHHNFATSAGVFVHNSTDSIQQMRKKRIKASYVSVDRDLLPYHDLREAIYEERCEWPEYMTFMRNGDTKLVEIAKVELLQLVDVGKKIDHPAGGSKDVTDAMAAVVYRLMGDRQYRRGLSSSSSSAVMAGSGGILDPFSGGSVYAGQGLPGVMDSFRNPPNPHQMGSLGSFMPPVPARLRRDEG